MKHLYYTGGFGFVTRTPRFIWLITPSREQSVIIPNKLQGSGCKPEPAEALLSQ